MKQLVTGAIWKYLFDFLFNQIDKCFFFNHILKAHTHRHTKSVLRSELATYIIKLSSYKEFGFRKSRSFKCWFGDSGFWFYFWKSYSIIKGIITYGGILWFYALYNNLISHIHREVRFYVQVLLGWSCSMMYFRVSCKLVGSFSEPFLLGLWTVIFLSENK